MAFDTQTRNRLARLVADCRDLLAVEFDAKLQEYYGIYADEGRVLAIDKLVHLDDDRLHIARLLRERIEHVIATDISGGLKGAVKRVLREQAFTVLNRFAAIRMAEERGIMVESVGGGLNSKAFKMFSEVAFSGLGDAYSRYRAFLRCTFDELSSDLGTLFDRSSPYGLLFPRQDVLLELFKILNAPDLKNLWSEDETIGWIYQYYNDPSERKKMREESSTPRNSRELAVRNQFFTPRYVVEFLADNTLGRLWYEMTCGETVLRDRCRHLVRRPTEIFLKDGESAPESTAASRAEEKPSQEDLLRAPVHILHRPIKDPRTIRVLDPACGSMHFGLYAFDLFECIYDEAWDIAHGTDEALRSTPSFAPFVSYAAQFADKATFVREAPRLIVEHNLHGIDIDPRAAQIAGLSLWLRAHRAWQRVGVKPADRPRITRSNLVCAEPMPGEKELLREFVEGAFPVGERSAFAFLLEKIFDCMSLAGEAGSLLRIEEEIRTAIAEARALAQRQSAPRQAILFAGTEQPEQEGFNLRGITTDEQFWEKAEVRIYEALETYAVQAENGGSFQRRLFANDAAQGFAFIDLCRKRYDVVLMNPPFGDASTRVETYCEKAYPSWGSNLAAAFISRCSQIGNTKGKVGCICDHSLAVRSTYEPFRRKHFISRQQLKVWVKLGWEVLDANVETFCAVYQSDQTDSDIVGIDLDSTAPSEKEAKLLELISASPEGKTEMSFLRHSTLNRLPNCVIDLTWPKFLIRIFEQFESLKAQGLEALAGHQLEADRHYRLYWELDFCSDPLGSGLWTMAFKGGDYSPGYLPEVFVALTGRNNCKVPESSANVLRNSPYQHHPGVGYGKRGVFVDAQPLRSSSIFTHEGFGFPLSSEDDRWLVLSFINSDLFSFGINKYCGQHKQSGYVNLFAFAPKAKWNVDVVRRKCSQFVRIKTKWSVIEESDYLFTGPVLLTLENFSEQSLRDSAASIYRSEVAAVEVASQLNKELNAEVYTAFGLTEADIKVCEEFCIERPLLTVTELGHLVDKTLKEKALVDQLLSWVVGLCFGRWDIRYATGDLPTPELPDPFAPLPVCPPGMLQGDDGLPISPEVGLQLRAAGQYPLDVAWDGILVDDPAHPLDLERRVRTALRVLWQERADELEHEACALLGVSTLREWFSPPSGFFADHLRRYSKSRRQAPIYWPLSTASGRYTLWIYYNRLSDQTLFHCVNNFVRPKIVEVEADLARAMTTDGDERTKRSTIEQLTAFRSELVDFRDELLRVGQSPYKPNLNDGALITAAPLWRLFHFPKWQNALKECWDELSLGKLDWAHIALTLWPQRVKKNCEGDYSLAIAHGLESSCKTKSPSKKVKASAKKATVEME